jgi:hypothetical protein
MNLLKPEREGDRERQRERERLWDLRSAVYSCELEALLRDRMSRLSAGHSTVGGRYLLYP